MSRACFAGASRSGSRAARLEESSKQVNCLTPEQAARAHSARVSRDTAAASHKGGEIMKRISLACIAFLAVEAITASLACAASARSSRPEAMTTGDGATIVSDLDIYGFTGDRGQAGADLVRPNYGSPECTTDEGHGYAWPCSRPGRNF
jgi:hypothetical protein